MRKFVVALLAALLAFALSGCGGGEKEAAVPTDPAAPAAVAPAEPTAGSTNATASPDGTLFAAFPLTEETPEAIKEAIAEGQPLVLFFFDPDQLVTNDVRAQINTVIDDNRGLADLYAYNLGSFAKADTQGGAAVEGEALQGDAAGQSTVALARELGVVSTPHVIVVDSQGYMIFRHDGFIDADLLERQVQRATE